MPEYKNYENRESPEPAQSRPDPGPETAAFDTLGVLKISSDFILREVAGENIIIPTGQVALEFNGIIAVNEVGLSIWQILQQGATFEELVARITEEYDVDADSARADAAEFVGHLAEHGFLMK